MWPSLRSTQPASGSENPSTLETYDLQSHSAANRTWGEPHNADRWFPAMAEAPPRCTWFAGNFENLQSPQDGKTSGVQPACWRGQTRTYRPLRLRWQSVGRAWCIRESPDA